MSFIKSYVRNLKDSRANNTLTEMALKSVRNPKLVFDLGRKYRDLERYDHSFSANYKWNQEAVSRMLANFFDERSDIFESYFEELASSDKMGKIEENLDSSPYRSSPREFGYRKILYVIVRYLEPSNIMESGVYEGVSSSFFLEAIRRNDSESKLHSVDYVEGGMIFPPGYECGWVIPQELKNNWNLIEGRSINKLEPLLDELDSVEVFFHDSKHSYTNMMYEYRKVLEKCGRDVLIVSDDIDKNDAFEDFNEKHYRKSLKIGNIGFSRNG